MDRHDRSVYLTFDDGPIPEATPFILDLLREHNIKATFFMVGDNVRKYPELYQRIVSEGHQVGNHTHNHISGLRHSIRHYSYNVEKANAYIHSHLIRPPHGWMRIIQYFLIMRRYKVVMWDLVTRDYSKWLTAEGVVDNVKRYARNGSIITFHDSLKSVEKLRTALPQSIEWLREQAMPLRRLSNAPRARHTVISPLPWQRSRRPCTLIPPLP